MRKIEKPQTTFEISSEVLSYLKEHLPKRNRSHQVLERIVNDAGYALAKKYLTAFIHMDRKEAEELARIIDEQMKIRLDNPSHG